MRTIRAAQRWALRAGTVLVVGFVPIAGGALLGAPAASAHPVDELQQKVYVTPVGEVLAVDVELTPAAEIAPAFIGTIDGDGDRVLSPAETEAHARSVAATLSLVVDGRPVPLLLDSSTYPEVRLMLGAAGTIVLALHADLPPSAGERTIVVSNAYAPSAASGPITTTVQTSVTPQPDHPVTVGAIDRDSTGRTMTVRYVDAPAQRLSVAAPAGSSATTSVLVVALGGTAAAVAAAAAARRSRRRTGRGHAAA